MRAIRMLCMTVLLLAAGFGQEKGPAAEPTTPEAIRQYDDEQLAFLAKQIAGKEKQSSAVVFQNIQILAGVPAGNLLKIMEIGFSRSLGVSCAHCHVAAQWDKDDKPPKQIARDMWKLMQTVNADLANIEGIKDRNPRVNCTSCHHGQVKPVLDM